MKKILLVFLLACSCYFVYAQTLQSPEQFLGYKVGEHFTPHYKIVSYFNAVAQEKPDMVKIEKYGETNEGRDLILAYIATPENLQRLEEIRMNNLRLTGMMKDRMAPVVDGAPAIVWLSYNVHGNEPASSEAAMKVLYALVDPNNKDTKEWLKNIVVIIDPCINPDGRDRYVNWYNNATGNVYDINPDAREHDEPWPHGRTNHYNFDLNRDWAWQTPKETQQRMKKYNEWLPQVHVDYHEQEYNAPYYFAPAAEPYHEVITAWQRDFQTQIGRNNAKYFDANGWLYFTKETFDLLYPSYGDTYPTYNGSIGMTYEQGGIGAGLAIKTDNGDTLTLTDRATHHYTTSLSTIEITSKNAAKVVSEYKKYFDDTRNAVGSEYKTYVLTAKDANEIQAVANLMQANGIEYGTTSATNFRGYDYFTGKEENYTNEGYQLAVSAYQPKGRLVKVLFEPKSYLSDSATYDITAWAIPYAYGIKAYAVKEKLDVGPFKTAPVINSVESNYGLLIPYSSMNAAKLLAYLLQKDIKVRYAEKPFGANGKMYDAGTLIILKGNNAANWNQVTNDACKKFNIQPDKAESGFVDKGADFGSPYIRFVKKPKVGLLTGKEVYADAAGEVWNYFDQAINYPISQINAEDISDVTLNNFDVLIVPNGSYTSLTDKDAQDALQDFVRKGGKIVALEKGASIIAGMDFGFKQKENADDSSKLKSTDYGNLKKYADRERDYLPSTIPGAIYKVLLDNTHPLAFGYPTFYYTLKQDSKLYDYLKDGWNVGVLKQSDYVSGFVGSKLKPKLKDGLLFGVNSYGNGNVVLLADDVLFRMFWENGKLLFNNAVFLTGD